ncbi:MAG: hypothetical protein B6226_03115 [Candidatus Cloacimonetes bacterium 4572_65]|nr:MAG: hypothetical protein B6226_03115 [Candidatus Cloacimonetes bacterium 4572_65]
MNYSSYINYIPYITTWAVKKLFRKGIKIDFYCGSLVDYTCFKKVHQHFPQVRVVAKTRSIQKALERENVKSILYPSFPDIVIMSRHSTRKYPGKSIKKIGMRHGPYHFKNFINARFYNQFDSFMFTSPTEALQAKERGINNGIGVGYPKMDDAFDGTISAISVMDYRYKANLDSVKPTIIFTATWNKTNYSAVEKWASRLNELTPDYNILVTVHDWTTQDIKDVITKTPGIFYIKDKNVLPYLMIADLFVGDISSIIAEFCALNKPMITFKILEGKRTTDEIITMLDEMTFRVDTFEELKEIIPQALTTEKNLHEAKRNHYNKIMFGDLDGKAHLRARDVIQKYIEEVK